MGKSSSETSATHQSSPASSIFSAASSNSPSSLCPRRPTNNLRTAGWPTAGYDSDSRSDLSSDLKLGLTLYNHTCCTSNQSSSSREEQRLHWPPNIKPLLRKSLAGKADTNKQYCRRANSQFVKVYMDGIPIGRKLDLLAHDGYNALIIALCHMFKTTNINLYSDAHERADHNSERRHQHILIYEDKEGDWMMVGDVPWEMFLMTVKRLKITRADRC